MKNGARAADSTSCCLCKVRVSHSTLYSLTHRMTTDDSRNNAP